MKIRNLFFAVLASAAVLVGCEKKEDLGGAKLELSTRTLEFDKAVASQTITITATRDWKADFSETWLNVGPESGDASSEAQTITISVQENTGAKREAKVTFTIGTISKELTVIQKGEAITDGSTILEETFASSLGTFTADNADIWKVDTQYKYVKASAYNVDGAPAESWLTSSVIDLTGEGAATLTFEHAGNFYNNTATMKELATVWAKTEGGEWTKLDVPVYPAGNAWPFEGSGDVDLSAYLGSKMQIGFKYAKSESVTGTWEIKNLKIVRSVAKKVLKVSTGDFAVSAGASTSTFDITSNTSWTIASSDDTNFSVSPSSGEGNATITVTVTENTGEDRSADITVSGTDANPISFKITQLKKTTGGTEFLIISEYVEGGSMEKYIELYNPTSQTVDLSQYTLSLDVYNSSNAKGETVSYTLSGSLDAGKVQVFRHKEAKKYTAALTGDEISKVCNFNGNDPIALLCNGVVVDKFGPDIVTGDFAKDKTFRRKATSKTASTVWIPGDWEELAKDTVDGLGSHTVE